LKHFNIHPDFEFNGVSYSKEELVELAYSFIKEGEPYEHELGDFLLDWLLPSHQITVQTSGSTGVPKKIFLLKEHMVNSALATGTYFNLKPKNSVLHCLPMQYIAGKMLVVRALVLGLHLDFIEPTSAPLSENTKFYNFAAMVPLQLQNSLKFIDCIDKLIVGGTPVTKEIMALIKDKSCQIYETYGMTETITHIAARRVNGANDKILSATVSPFKVLPKVVISKDKRDCLVIDAPHISKEIVYTNDLVRLISDSEFVWLGRYDNIINSGGVKLIPEQIELLLSSILKNRFFVTGLPDEKLGQKLILIIEGKVDKEEILKKIKLSGILDKYQIPKEVYAVNTFKETDNGKVLRNKTLETI